MNYTKVLGKCLSTSCPKKSLGKCHNFSLGGETSSACGYCGCSEGAHQLVGHIPLANQAPPVVPQTPVPPTPPRTPVEGPKLHQRALLIAERKKIFETAPSVPTKKSSPKKRSLIDMMNSSKKQRTTTAVAIAAKQKATTMNIANTLRVCRPVEALKADSVLSFKYSLTTQGN